MPDKYENVDHHYYSHEFCTDEVLQSIELEIATESANPFYTQPCAGSAGATGSLTCAYEGVAQSAHYRVSATMVPPDMEL